MASTTINYGSEKDNFDQDGRLQYLGPRAKKAHKLFSHKLSVPPFVPGIVPGTNRVCPRDKPGEIGLPLCKIRRKPGFVPGFHRICPRDKPGEIPGQTRGRPNTNRTKEFMFMCLFLALGPVHPPAVPRPLLKQVAFTARMHYARHHPRKYARSPFP